MSVNKHVVHIKKNIYIYIYIYMYPHQALLFGLIDEFLVSAGLELLSRLPQVVQVRGFRRVSDES